MSNISTQDTADRAVSPVIGVILMVAITVILAAVIGTFVLGLTDQTGTTAPTAQMSVSDANEGFDTSDTDAEDFLTINHNSGADIDADSIRIVIRNESDNARLTQWEQGSWGQNHSAPATGDIPSNWFTVELNGDTLTSDDTIGTGDVVTIRSKNSTGPILPQEDTDYQIQIIHPDSESQLVDTVVRVK